MQTRAFHTTRNIRSRASSRCYTFEACVVGTDQVRGGAGEVDVLGTFVVEVVGYTMTVEVLAAVVVHVFVEGLDESKSLGVDGSRSRFRGGSRGSRDHGDASDMCHR